LSAPTIFDETLYFTTVESRLVALNIKTGNVDWEKQYPLPLSSKFSIRGHGQPVVSGGRIHVGFSDGVFRVFSVKKKSLIWEYKLTEGKGPFYDVDMEPLVTEEGSIYIASYQGELVSLSKSGKLIWKNEIGSGVNLKLNGDILYASSTDGNVYALGKNKGTIIWETKLNTGNLTAPALHNSTLVVGTSEKLIYFINATNGDIMARRFAKKGVSTNPLISDGRLYYLSNGGLLYCLKLT
jgi:outer membrane protein assembly factor BamB